MRRVLISLLGGRPVPNILTALHLKPDYFYIIASQDSLSPGGSYDKAISALPENLQPSQPLSVRPYVLQDTIARCREIANKHNNDEIIINSASEPKTMTFGAYDFAKSLKVDGRSVDICYLSREGFVWAFRDRDTVESAKISLQEYFASYGWNINLKRSSDCSKFGNLVLLLAEYLSISHNLLCVLRSSDRGKGKRSIKCNKQLNEDEFDLLKKIEALGIISNVQRENMTTGLTLNNDEDARLLLTGDWLEYYVFQRGLNLVDSRGKTLFDECAWGVEDSSSKGEIDFVGIFAGQMVIASCKTEDSIKRSWFEDLHSKAEQLGKGMCSTLLISSVSKDKKNKKDLDDYERWAKERQIVLVMAEDIPSMLDILKKIVKGDKDLDPKHIPYYARI